MLGGIAAGIIFIAIAIMFWTVPPKSLPLPNFLGHEKGVSAVHVKHGVASFLVGAWPASPLPGSRAGRSASARRRSDTQVTEK